MKVAVIIAALAAVLTLALALIGAIGKAMHTASQYMQLLYEDDREAILIGTREEMLGRFKWWIHKSPHKRCSKCCLFCEYTQACLMDVSEEEAKESMQQFLAELKEKIQRGETLDEHEQKAYIELELLDSEGKL